MKDLIAAQDAVTTDDFLIAAEKETQAERRLKFVRLATWIKAHAPHSQIGDTWFVDPTVPEGAGIVAARDIEADELIMSIPRALMMSFETALKSPIGGLIARDPMLNSQRSLALSLHLFLERMNPDSPWAVYIDTLPTKFTSPFTATLAELAPLRGSAEFYSILTTFKALVRQYCHSYTLLRSQKRLNLPLPTFKQFRWACLTIMARQNRIPATNAVDTPRGPTTVLCLIPGFDCFNHVDMVGEITTCFVPTNQCSETTAPRAVKKGEQIYIIYGERPNSKLFTYQGFVVPNLSTDKVRVPFSMPVPPPTPQLAGAGNKKKDQKKTDPLSEARIGLLSRLALFHPEIELPLKTKYAPWDQMPPPFAPLSAFRDAWKAAYVRSMEKNEIDLTTITATNVLQNLNSKFLGDALIKVRMMADEAHEKGNQFEPPGIMFQEDCPAHILPRVNKMFKQMIEAALMAYAVDAEIEKEGDSEITKLCRMLIKEEKNLLKSQLALFETSEADASSVETKTQ